MSRLISIGRIGVWLAASVALTGAAPAQLPSDPPSYELRFDRPAKASKFSEVYPGLATWAYFGAEPPARAKGQAISRQLRATSRMWPGTLNVNVDPDYCPGATTPSVSEGALQIEAYRLADKDVGTCGLGRPWASAYVSSQPSFSQAYGYFEVDARLPCDPGRWPAFWLLPTAKTAENGGRLAEIDVFEHYGGPITVISQGRPFVINRVGQPFSTLHAGKVGAEQAFSNARTLPALTEAQRQALTL